MSARVAQPAVGQVPPRPFDPIPLAFEPPPLSDARAATGRRTLEMLGVFLAFAALTALCFWQVLPHLAATLLGPPEDNLQDFWNSWYAAQGHEGGFFFTRLIRAPEGTSLYYHSFAYPQVFAVWGLSRIFGTSLPVLTLLQNLTNLASFPLAGLGAYWLCRYLGAGRLGAAAGGFIFAFNPWHVAQALHHAHVAGIEFLPFFVLCYLKALERKDFAWLAGAILFYALSALSCWYYLFYCFYFVGFHLIYLRLSTHRWPRGWQLAVPALCLGGVAVLLAPLLAPMLQSGLHGNAYQGGGNVFVADLLGYTAFPPTHFLGQISANLYRHFSGNPWEDTVYLGLVNLALLAWGFWRTSKADRRTLWYALGGMLFFAVLASGEALHWRGMTLPIHMPDIVLARLPFFANVRTPARAIVFVYLFLGVGVGIAITTMRKRLRPAVAGAGFAILVALMLLDFYPAHLQTTAMSCAPDLNILAQDPDRTFAVLDLPFGYRESNFYMAEQACHGRPIAQGVVARQLKPTLADHLIVKDLAVQRRQLQAAKIKYILLHRPRNGLFAWNNDFDGKLSDYRKTYTVAAEGPETTILRVY